MGGADLLFSEPNAEQLVSGGFHHEWPDARGVFFNTNRDVLAWLNQEDHVSTLIATQWPVSAPSPFIAQSFSNQISSSRAGPHFHYGDGRESEARLRSAGEVYGGI